jgi:Ca-activated chloride channel homolog
MFRIAHPFAFLLLFALIALAVAAAALVRRRGHTWPGWWPWPAALLTCLAPVLLVLALADPQTDAHRQPPTVLAVDDSASISRAGITTESRWIAKVTSDNCVSPCRIVRFAGSPTVSALPADSAHKTGKSSTADNGGGQRATVGTGTDAQNTNLRTALQTAIGLLPRGGRVVALTDGAQTQDDLLATAPMARARGVHVDWVRLPAATRPDAAITELSAPATVRSGDQVPLTLTIHSNVAGNAVLSVRSGTGIPREQTVHLSVGDNPQLLFYTASNRGWQSFEALVTLRGDARTQNNAAYVATQVVAAPRVMAVQSGPSPLTNMLTQSGLQPETVGPSGLPHTAAGYARLDAVVLNDVSAKQLDKAQIVALNNAVRHRGLGLLVVGGAHSLSLGHYAKSGLQGLLPVDSLIPGNLQRRNVAIELVLDHSGSMIDEAGGVPKIAMARVAASDSAGFIAAHKDQIGVVDFDIAAHILVPLQRISDATAEHAVDKKVSGLQASGGTNIYLGLKRGYEQLLKSSAQERHIILMTDGISEPANYKPLLAKLHAAHITVATVALGQDADRSLLAKIAAGTGGHAYVTNDAKQLPKIFAKETQLAAKPAKVKGKLVVSAAGDSAVVRSLVGKALPGLTGNVVTTLRPGAQADLIASNTKGKTDPALAEWQIGAGRVVVWTPGVGAPWAAAWVGEHELFNDSVRWVDRPAGQSPFVPHALAGSSGILQIDLAPAGTSDLDVAGITGTLTDQGNYSFPVTFKSVGAGLFQADTSSFPPGVYRYQLTTQSPNPKTTTGAVAIPYAAEYSPATAQASPVGQLVAQTGGVVLGPTDEQRLAITTGSLRWLLELLGLLVFLAGVIGRVAPTLVQRLRRRSRDSHPPALPDDETQPGSTNSSDRPLSSSSVSASTVVGADT